MDFSISLEKEKILTTLDLYLEWSVAAPVKKLPLFLFSAWARKASEFCTQEQNASILTGASEMQLPEVCS